MNRLYLFSSFFLMMLSSVLLACGDDAKDDPNNVMSKFNSTFNIYEKFETVADGSINYKAVPWGGLVGTFLTNNMPADLSGYESITFEFAEPTPVPTQVVVADRFKTWGKRGISTLTCHFDGQDVKSVGEIVLQASDSCNLTLKHIYLTPNDATWQSTPVWQGKCAFGNWQDGFVVKPEKFADAYEGDKIEFIFSTDKSNPELTYWLFKTIYNGTTNTLEGNESELNEWGCAAIGKNSTVYRIVLTANDVKHLSEEGLFVNGFYTVVSQVNLLHRVYNDSTSDFSQY